MSIQSRCRSDPKFSGPYVNFQFAGHKEFYNYTQKFTNSRRILDLACGEEHGDFISAENTEKVYAQDVSPLSK